MALADHTTPFQTRAGPADAAAARVSRAGLALGAMGLASAVFVLVRLLETWRVTTHASSHEISLLGLRLSYPAANLAAVVIVFLAALGLAVTVMACLGAVREVAGSRRFAAQLRARGLTPLQEAWLFEDVRPRAFCAGLLHPKVYVSTAAVARLDPQALEVVLRHERHHARRRDPLRLAVGRVLARALFFTPGLKELVCQQQALAEVGADEMAIGAAPENRSALARAMLSFADDPGGGDAIGIDAARVDHLLGEAPSWRFPVLVWLAGVAVVALMTAVAVLAGQMASGSATLAAPFLSDQPCILVLAMLPAAVGVIAVGAARWIRP